MGSRALDRLLERIPQPWISPVNSPKNDHPDLIVRMCLQRVMSSPRDIAITPSCADAGIAETVLYSASQIISVYYMRACPICSLPDENCLKKVEPIKTGKKRFSSSCNLNYNEPEGGTIMGDAGMWVLLAMSVVCFAALIATNRAGDSDEGGSRGGGGSHGRGGPRAPHRGRGGSED